MRLSTFLVQREYILANKSLFQTHPGKVIPKTDTVNKAGGKAYAFTPEQALAQLAVTGCLSNTFYTEAQDQLEDVIKAAQQCSPEYVAKCAVYARKQGHMKDMPALLCSILASQAKHGSKGDEYRKYLEWAFPIVIDNDKMLRNFVQMLRSGVTGRKSMGTAVRRLVRNWFAARSNDQLFMSSVGKAPSLKDIIKLARPAPGESLERAATFKYLLEQPAEAAADEETKKKGLFYKPEQLPEMIRSYEAFKAAPASTEIPKVPFQMLTHLPLTTKQWTDIALQGPWHFVRMNLNTFARHFVLKDPGVVSALAEKLVDAETIKRSRVFPYQLLTAYQATQDNTDIPMALKLALQDAMELATNNTPSLGEDVWVFPDVSGSMRCPVTGMRAGASSKTRCVDVAALFAACVLRTTPESRVIPVDTRLHTQLHLNPRDSVMTNAKTLAGCGGGGTSLHLALDHIIQHKHKAKTIVFFSDNESWVGSALHGNLGTKLLARFREIQAQTPECKLICIDLQPGTTTQAKSDPSVLNVGGFSDAVWTVLESFVQNKGADAWVDAIKAIPYTPPVVVQA